MKSESDIGTPSPDYLGIERDCMSCGKTMVKPKWMPWAKYAKRKFCSRACLYKGAPFRVVAQRKLTYEQADEIRERLSGGEKQGALAKEYGVSEQAISAINTKRTYRREA